MIAAAILKSLDPAPFLQFTRLAGIDGAVFLAWIALAELWLGIAIVIAAIVQPVAAWRLCFTVFIAFSFVAAAATVLGAASCGCWGRLSVSPGVMCVFDVSAAGLLWWLRPNNTTEFRFAFAPKSILAPAIVAFCLTATVSPLVLGHLRQSNSPAPAGLTIHGNLIVAAPDDWTGQPLPVTPWLENAQDLRFGRWRVVFYHHDCPSCRRLLDRISEQEISRDVGGRPSRVALIEVPPFGRETRPEGIPHLRLSPERDWFVATPLTVDLQDGVCTAVHEEDRHAL